MAAMDSLSQHQFAPPPLDPSAQLAGKGEAVDLSWADRDLDPVLFTSNTPAPVLKSPSATISQMKTGYKPENFRT